MKVKLYHKVLYSSESGSLSPRRKAPEKRGIADRGGICGHLPPSSLKKRENPPFCAQRRRFSSAQSRPDSARSSACPSRPARDSASVRCWIWMVLQLFAERP
ncbi:hypothetical protein MHYP_G00166910 [Metynnis hypsauchen]